MTTLNDLFIEYLASIQPYSKAVERAQLAHTCLREDLEGDESLGSHMLNSFLSGSYGRSTSIKGIKDVDVVILLITLLKSFLNYVNQMRLHSTVSSG